MTHPEGLFQEPYKGCKFRGIYPSQSGGVKLAVQISREGFILKVVLDGNGHRRLLLRILAAWMPMKLYLEKKSGRIVSRYF
jgi:hypothetical protein